MAKRPSDVALLESSPYHLHILRLPLELLYKILADDYLSPDGHLYTVTQMEHLMQSLSLVCLRFHELVSGFLLPSAVRFLSGAILWQLKSRVLERFTGLQGLSLCDPVERKQSSHLDGGVLASLANLTFLRVQGDRSLVRDLNLTGLTRLRELRIEHNRTLSYTALEAFGAMTTLESLCLWDTRVELSATTAQRAWRPALRSLSVCRTEPLDLRDFTSLTELNAQECRLSGMERLTRLCCLSLRACTSPTPLDAVLLRLVHLEMLEMTDSTMAFDPASVPLSVNELRLDHYSVRWDCAVMLPRLTNLTTLKLSHFTRLLFDEPLTTLRTLRVYGEFAPVQDAVLAQMTQLTGLELSQMGFGALGISDDTVAALRNLRYLVLAANSSISDAALTGLTALRYLDLSYNQAVTDAALTCLTALTELQLHSNLRITDAGLAPLVNLRALQCTDAIITTPCREKMERAGVVVIDERDCCWGLRTPLDYEWCFMFDQF